VFLKILRYASLLFALFVSLSLLDLGHTAIDEQLDLGDVAAVVAAREGCSSKG
jgi:hypothetical protein